MKSHSDEYNNTDDAMTCTVKEESWRMQAAFLRPISYNQVDRPESDINHFIIIPCNPSLDYDVSEHMYLHYVNRWVTLHRSTTREDTNQMVDFDEYVDYEYQYENEREHRYLLCILIIVVTGVDTHQQNETTSWLPNTNESVFWFVARANQTIVKLC